MPKKVSSDKDSEKDSACDDQEASAEGSGNTTTARDQRRQRDPRQIDWV